MSRRASPTAIGTFVLIALVLTVVGIVFFGSLGIFRKEQRYILYFEDSVNGLNLGSPVKFKGVPVGQVEQIYIRYNQSAEIDAIPVLIEIDVDKVSGDLGVDADITDLTYLREQIDAGLRGQLVLDSLITGLLFIELSYHPDAGEPEFVQEIPEYPEIPTVPKAFSELGNSANQLLANLAAIDVASINDELIRLLANINVTLEALDIDSLNTAAISTLNEIETTLSSPDFVRFRNGLDELVASLTELSRRTSDQMPGWTSTFNQTARQLRDTLASVEIASDEVGELFRSDAALGLQLERALREFAAAMESVRRLTDYLERNPNALLSGKQTGSGDF